MITNTGRNLCKKVVRITLTNDTTSETLFIFDGFDFFRGVHVTRFFTGWPERRAVPIEDILYAELDLEKCVEGKQYHDVVGGYQRLDVFDLKVDRTRRKPATFTRKSSTRS